MNVSAISPCGRGKFDSSSTCTGTGAKFVLEGRGGGRKDIAFYVADAWGITGSRYAMSWSVVGRLGGGSRSANSMFRDGGYAILQVLCCCFLRCRWPVVCSGDPGPVCLQPPWINMMRQALIHSRNLRSMLCCSCRCSSTCLWQLQIGRPRCRGQVDSAQLQIRQCCFQDWLFHGNLAYQVIFARAPPLLKCISIDPRQNCWRLMVSEGHRSRSLCQYVVGGQYNPSDVECRVFLIRSRTWTPSATLSQAKTLPIFARSHCKTVAEVIVGYLYGQIAKNRRGSQQRSPALYARCMGELQF